MCPEVRADAACTFPSVINTGDAFTLPLEFHTCGCCIQSECSVVVQPAQRRLSLTSTLCPDPCDCDTCEMPTVECEVPGLAEGEWTVEVNGAEGFRLEVRTLEPDLFAPPPPRCVDFAQPDACTDEGSLLDRLEPMRVEELCMRRGFGDLTHYLTVTDWCSDCGTLEGTCDVRVEPRFTDDLPPGGEIHVIAAAHHTGCDIDCPAICIRDEQRCAMPELVPGNFYRVHLHGELVHSFYFDPRADLEECVTGLLE